MKSPLKKLFCVLALCGTMFLSACSFFGKDAAMQISSVTSEYNDQTGITYVTISYTDESVPPTVLQIPRGNDGERGNGIARIDHRPNDQNTATIITLYYTDPLSEPVELTLPYGTFITSVQTVPQDDQNATTLIINLSDGTQNSVTLYNGKDGLTITDIATQTDSGVTYIVVTLSDGQSKKFPMPQGVAGEDGRGILQISLDAARTAADPANIWLSVTYTDYWTESISVPKSSGWHNGRGVPSKGMYSVGDYYVDLSGYAIYYKEVDGEWKTVMDFSGFSEETHTVNFIDRGPSGEDFVIVQSITVTNGRYFAPLQTLPSPQRTGYQFSGWYTSWEQTPNSGKFSDLTPVWSDLALYARWQPAGQ